MSRVYNTVNLSIEQQLFLKKLDDLEVVLFDIRDIDNLMGESIQHPHSILENLASKGFLSRLQRGKYCRSTFHNDFATGCFLVKDGAVAYWSALNVHGLTTRFANKIFIQTTQPKKEKIIGGTTFDFVKISGSKQVGLINLGYGNNSFRITDLEKTLVDCFDLSAYSGGFADLLTSFSTTQLSPEKLIAYHQAVGNKAALKRMGFLAEILDKKELSVFIAYAKSEITNTYDLFDPQGSRTGIPLGQWRLRMNIPTDQILAICKPEAL